MERGVSPEIVDTTLRDGEQKAGVVFSPEERLRIASGLSRAGIRWIEAGIPAMGNEERETLRAMMELRLAAELIAWNRAERSDIQSSADCGFTYVHMSLPVSDLHIEHKLRKSREWVLERLREMLDFTRSLGCTPFVGAEDASRADPEFLLRYAEAAAAGGAERLRFADTVGCLDPFETFRAVRYLTDRSILPVEFHGHNDFGLAAANTLSAFQAGAAMASVTVSGIGERAGNAALEEVASAVRTLFQLDTGVRLSELPALSDLVARASGRQAAYGRSVLGAIIQ